MKRMIGSVIVALVGLSLIAGPTQAAETPRTNSAEYLEQLEEIAGKPVAYTPVKAPGDLENDGTPTIQPFALDPAGCTLYPSQTHLRKSGNYGTVGAKPYTRCGVAISRISQSSTLYIIEWAGLYSRPVLTKDSTNTGQKNLTQTNVAWSCVNWNNSKFQQVTRGTTTVGSKNYFSIVSTIKDTWGCGY